MPDGAPFNQIKLLNEPTLGCVVVTFYGAAEDGIHKAYKKQTMPKRRTMAAVMQDIHDARESAEEHVRATHCPAHVDQQTFKRPDGSYYTQALLRVTCAILAFEPVTYDDWGPWMGPGGQHHPDYRWTD